MWGKDYLKEERRKYIRLDSVLPVQFRIMSLDEKNVLSDWMQGFTNNIGKGGICLEVNNLNPELLNLIKNKQAKLSLAIEMPFTKNPVSTLSKIVWIKDVSIRTDEPSLKEQRLDKYFIGLNYEGIAPYDNKRIIRYARVKKLFIPVVLAMILILGAGFVIGSYLNVKLMQGNKAIVGQLIKILQESSVAKQRVKEINKEREDLQLKIQVLQMRIKTAEEEKAALRKQTALEQKVKLEELNTQIVKLVQEKNALQEQLTAIQHQENGVTEELLRLDKRKATLEKANLDKMYNWLKMHQNPRTGFIMSFEGESDVAGWAFIYEQSLVLQAYTNFSDFERVKKMLDFFAKKAEKREGLFFNAYYVSDGQPVEYVVHSGANIWLGIAILQYTKKTQDFNYLGLAEDIAKAIINLQSQDKDGGIGGGPNVERFATEHNLDAYAFFNMLYKITGKQDYLEARDKVLNWLIQHTYDNIDVPVKRERRDSAIATDTYAWSIVAVGPEKLEELGMSPDRIIEFAEQNCGVEVSYERPEGQTIKIKGFDFAPQRHLARGGVVSSEWTAQMVIAFKIMADFYYKKGMIAKSRSYALKADEYLVELSNMIISSPLASGQGQSCLPYATQDSIDTGHGWITPPGKSTGSVAATTLALFAFYNYNPLEFKE